jgi:O-antigen/teichoic acid export membrane protein
MNKWTPAAALNTREEGWTESNAVGSKIFVEGIREKLPLGLKVEGKRQTMTDTLMSVLLSKNIFSYRKRSGLKAELIRSGLGLGGVKLIGIPIGLATSVMMARGLGVEAYGTYTYVLSLVSLLALPAYAGLPALLVREVSKYHQSENLSLLNGLTRRAHYLVLLLGLSIMTGLLVLAFWKASWSFDDRWTLMTLAAVMIPLTALTQVRTAILRGLNQVIQSYIPEMIVRPAFFLLIVSVLFLTESLNPASALSVQVAATFTSFLVASVILKRRKNTFHTRITYDEKRWKIALLPFAAIAGVSYLNSQMMLPLIGILSSDAEVAIFKVSFAIALIIGTPLTIVESIIHPHITREYVKGDKSKIFKLVTRSGLAALLFSLPLFLLFIFFGQWILKTMYGGDFSGAYLPLVTIATGFIIVNLVGPSMLLLHATNFEKDALVISTGGAILMVALCIAWIPPNGALGGAFAFAISKVTRAVAFRIWAQFRLSKSLPQEV